jgi:hypothetical protein
MKLTKKQKNELFNAHVGVGFIVYKTSENNIKSFYFYTSQKNTIHKVNNMIPNPAINLNEEVTSDLIFDE